MASQRKMLSIRSEHSSVLDWLASQRDVSRSLYELVLACQSTYGDGDLVDIMMSNSRRALHGSLSQQGEVAHVTPPVSPVESVSIAPPPQQVMPAPPPVVESTPVPIAPPVVHSAPPPPPVQPSSSTTDSSAEVVDWRLLL